jgi:hypothetical protein
LQSPIECDERFLVASKLCKRSRPGLMDFSTP